jgi:hypothetical protein
LSPCHPPDIANSRAKKTRREPARDLKSGLNLTRDYIVPAPDAPMSGQTPFQALRAAVNSLRPARLAARHAGIVTQITEGFAVLR